ncbi:MAG: phage/plasmid primase, P4 family [Actinomycetota bacterium]|nr:phage/plasmid primase, P4 family [Actinomycetota bacterium]
MPDNIEEVDRIAELDEPAPSEVHRGQARIAYRLADRYANRLLHVHGIGWHTWDGTRWALDNVGHAKRAVLDVLRLSLAESLGDKELRADVRKCESASGVSGVLDIAGALPEFAATARDLDADPYLLNCSNGTLDLRTLELRSHDPADRVTKVCRAAYDPAAPGSTWDKHLTRVLPGADVRAYLQRLTGVALVGKVLEHVLGILTGTGANGKTVFINALAWSLGDYASTAEPDLFMHREGAHPTGEMDLLGRRLVVVSESERNRRLAEATMKRLTGGDTIRARKMRQDFIEFEPSHTALLVTNHLPKVAGDDPAIWRRLRVIPFSVEIPPLERDQRIGESLQAEADAVLAWAVAGWVAYRRQDGLAEPADVVAATDDYHQSSDAVGRFVAEACLTSSPVVKATTGQLFEAWDRWRLVDGAEPISQKAFGQALDRLGFPAGRAVNGKRWRVGIALSAVDDEQ